MPEIYSRKITRPTIRYVECGRTKFRRSSHKWSYISDERVVLNVRLLTVNRPRNSFNNSSLSKSSTRKKKFSNARIRRNRNIKSSSENLIWARGTLLTRFASQIDDFTRDRGWKKKEVSVGNRKTEWTDSVDSRANHVFRSRYKSSACWPWKYMAI